MENLTLDTTVKHNKSAYINKMFASIAGKYDLLNNLMTCGLHNEWKKDAIKTALKINKHPEKALDLCSGTGDLAIIINKLSSETEIICADNCQEMLDIADVKIAVLKKIKTELSDVENLSFNNSSFDLITIGFGLRNLVNKEKCIENIYKILKPGGIFVCIDLGHPNTIIWKDIYSLFFYKIIPKLGSIFAKNEEAYTYLPNSLKTWYTQEELKNIILRKGFNKCTYKNYFGGVVASHVALK